MYLQIWDLSDPGGKGYLDKAGLFVALKMVALVQMGKEPSLANVNIPTPPPNMVSVCVCVCVCDYIFTSTCVNNVCVFVCIFMFICQLQAFPAIFIYFCCVLINKVCMCVCLSVFVCGSYFYRT